MSKSYELTYQWTYVHVGPKKIKIKSGSINVISSHIFDSVERKKAKEIKSYEARKICI